MCGHPKPISGKSNFESSNFASETLYPGQKLVEMCVCAHTHVYLCLAAFSYGFACIYVCASVLFCVFMLCPVYACHRSTNVAG